MKKITTGFITLAMLAVSVISAPAVSASDGDRLDVGEEAKTKIAECLDTQKVEEPTGEFEVKGYDLDSASKVYNFHFYRYIESWNISDTVESDSPYYIVSFSNDNKKGEAFILTDSNGKLKLNGSVLYADYESRTPYTNENFYHKEISELLDGYSDVSDLMLCSDSFECLNFAYFKSGGKEYVIPYSYQADSTGVYSVMPCNKVYAKEEFDEIIKKNISIPEEGSTGGEAVLDFGKDSSADTGSAGGGMLLVPALVLMLPCMLLFRKHKE